MTPSKKATKHHIDIEYQRVLKEGNLYKQDLDKLLELFQLPSEVISKFGMLSVDFGYVREIIAVMGYEPRIIVANQKAVQRKMV